MQNKATNTIGVATRFVDFVLKHKLDEMQMLTASEIQIFFDVVSATGFSIERVTLGRLTGNYIGYQCYNIGEPYVVNKLCPFKVMNEEAGDHYFATSWLDCIFRRVFCAQQGEGRGELIEVIDEEIKQDIPLEPIKLTYDGDFLCEFPPSKPLQWDSKYPVRHTRDDDVLPVEVGIHQFCGGLMIRKVATHTLDAIVCRSCSVPRILFPEEIKTYGDLRKAINLRKGLGQPIQVLVWS